MSVNRLPADEQGIYFLGLAVQRQLERLHTQQLMHPDEPQIFKEMLRIYKWIEESLTPDEFWRVCQRMRHVFDDEFEDKYADVAS